jgi:hypothetical protein
MDENREGAREVSVSHTQSADREDPAVSRSTQKTRVGVRRSTRFTILLFYKHREAHTSLLTTAMYL